VDNREALTTTTGVVTYTYDAANRLTGVGGETYTWDERGNLTHDGTFTTTYDAAGRLVGAQSITNTLVYTYNGDGVRVAMAVDGVETRWVQDVTGLPEVLSEASGGSAMLYVYGAARLSQVEDGAYEWFLGDALGSVRQVVDDSGEIVLVRDYSPFGVARSESGAGSSGYGFTGEQWDGYTQFVYLRARWMDPYPALYRVAAVCWCAPARSAVTWNRRKSVGLLLSLPMWLLRRSRARRAGELCS
jgi:YD repeat-containing protein